MADPTSVNGKATDAATQANAQILGVSSAQSMAMVYQTMAQSVALSMQNAVAAQQQMQTLSQAITSQAVQSIMSIDTDSIHRRTLLQTIDSDVLSQLTELISLLSKTQQTDPTPDQS